MYQKDLEDKAVAGVALGKMELPDLIDFALAKQKKMDFAKSELEAINSEIQQRAVAFQENRHIKFTEWYGSGKGSVAVTMASKMTIDSFTKLKAVLGQELTREKVRIKEAETKYELAGDFKQAVIALLLGDYDSTMEVGTVIDHAGWCADCPDKKTLILKKLKGDYKQDKKTVLAALQLTEGEIDIDAELFMIYQIKNYDRILTYFGKENLGQIREQLKQCITVSETARISLKVV